MYPLCKQIRLPFNKQGSSAEEQIDVIHSDIYGPVEVKLIGKSILFVTFIDDKTSKIFLYFLKMKAFWLVTKIFGGIPGNG